MPKVTPRVHTMTAPVMWPFVVKHIDDDIAIQRYAEMRPPALYTVHDYMLALHDLDIPVDRDLFVRMLDTAERKYAEQTGRKPTPVQLRTSRYRHDPVVYYMRLGDLVKIGWSSNVNARREAIGPQGVMALEFGTKTLERERHKQFIHCHEHGEWFKLDEQLAAWIVDRRAAFEAVAGMTVERWMRGPRDVT